MDRLMTLDKEQFVSLMQAECRRLMDQVAAGKVKGRGRRWDLDNVEAMMALEALHQSTGLWDRYWANAFAHRN